MNCEWHCNFTFPKTAHCVKCTTIKDVHNHEIVNPSQVPHMITRYQRFSEEMMQDLQFFIDCKVAPIVTLEMLKKKYPQHIFHKQDVYNTIYKLCQSNNHEKSSDSTSLLDTLFEKAYSGCHHPSKNCTEDFLILCLMITLEFIKYRDLWEFMIKTFPECQCYMIRILYPVRMNWAKAYTPFQFNAGIQSTQSVESFNGIIKKSLNAASTLCDVQEAIDKRHKEEIKYCQLVDLKAKYTTIGLPHISSQFFSSVDIIVKFLTPLILSLQQFQISQSFTYKGQIAPEVYI
ncbi:hypothetical protein RhiirC2_721566 [Rhizophagus irregularis]|uniref:MULE transposase domain-containing protein n=1 Tax=Rhizophagus irregularis TaxID=588596 RepID=A0A2N1M5I5_9GLOM|nr:hypothetical protein RhiirC2_721566 [Rhizophagus irregularis]